MKLENFLLTAVIVLTVSALVFVLFPFLTHKNPVPAPAMSKASMMLLTEFDRMKGHEMMDKDNDGKCDVCGMPVEMCLDSGQIECNMGGSATIGVLGSQHIHANWKIFVNGQAYNWSSLADRHERQMHGDLSIKDTSAFIHVHPEITMQSGDLLHMHATGIPLSLFFESMGMRISKGCLEISAQEKYCTDTKNSLKFYVNGETNNQYGDYIFANLDKILISYGPKNEGVSSQLASITSFGGNN